MGVAWTSQAAEKRLSGCSPGLQSGEAGFQTRLNATQKKNRGFSPGVCVLLAAGRISSLHENWVWYQGKTSVVPQMIENTLGFSP
jgi:hypothetical protein